MNYVVLCFSLATTSLLITSILLNLFEAKLPVLVSQIFRYGKFANKESGGYFSKVNIKLPKSRFKHFYILASIWYGITFVLVTAVYILKHPVPLWIIELFNVACGEKRVTFVSPTQVYVAVCLMTLQVFRRFYDTHFVSIFGKNSYINYSHYLLGMFWYPATALAILCEAPIFVQTSQHGAQEVDFSSLSFFELSAVVLFLWACWHQYTTTKILANLRKNKKGEVITNDHKLPHGDWFEYISSPPQAAEILIYTSLTIILRNNITWLSLYMFVVVNQVETMLLSHWWYQETFKEMPKQRKAVIPFVY